MRRDENITDQQWLKYFDEHYSEEVLFSAAALGTGPTRKTGLAENKYFIKKAVAGTCRSDLLCARAPMLCSVYARGVAWRTSMFHVE